MRSRSIVVRALVGPRPAASAIRRTTVSEIAAFRAPPSGERGPALTACVSRLPLKVGLARGKEGGDEHATARVPVACARRAPREAVESQCARYRPARTFDRNAARRI